jgi:Domain of unknown function (DUF4389)
MTATGTYPARLDGRVDQPLNPWLWLVKWVLVIPHAVVLAFLWLATAVLTIVAGVAILFTGVYPRAIFDFHVGVMRWTWRVAFYSLSAFGTDRYPPFSLQPDPDYPADFAVEYPERLSRGLVLVKWWLLALPQYLIVAAFTGGWELAGPGVIAVLAVVAMVINAFRHEYPEPVFDFVMGMNRWCFRVFAYVLLMRDEYPPFRLDAGGPDPATAQPTVPTRPAPTVPSGSRSAPQPA